MIIYYSESEKNFVMSETIEEEVAQGFSQNCLLSRGESLIFPKDGAEWNVIMDKNQKELFPLSIISGSSRYYEFVTVEEMEVKPFKERNLESKIRFKTIPELKRGLLHESQ